jgi:hydroxypyruvate reductase
MNFAGPTIDIDTARKRDIALGYTPDVLTDCVADTAFSLLLDVARRTSAADRFVRRGAWMQSAFPLATKVTGKRLGIVGLGRVGSAIARRAAGFEMAVRYHNPHPVEGSSWDYAHSITELAHWCDFLVIAAAGSAGLLVTSEVIEALGPQGFLINIARGSVVDELALIQALRQGRLAGAGLDVYAREPQVPSALMDMEQVVLLPHIASATHETRAAMAKRVLANLDCFFAGKALLSPVP